MEQVVLGWVAVGFGGAGCSFRGCPASHSLLQNIFGCGSTSGEQEACPALIFESRVHGSDLCRRRWNSVRDVHKLGYVGFAF